jgi:hypothetical protein
MNLADILKPGHPLPADDVMIAKALDILNHSPHGQKLSDFVAAENVTIKLIETPQPVTYLPDTRIVYLGFNRAHPVSPQRFVLMLSGVLREAQQESAGIKNPPLTAPRNEHMKIGMAKFEDKLWFMCTIACELDLQEAFTDYKFLDELRQMGHTEVIDLYLKQEGRK